MLSPSACARWGREALDLIHGTVNAEIAYIPVVALLIFTHSRRYSVDEPWRRIWSYYSCSSNQPLLLEYNIAVRSSPALTAA